MTPSSIHPAWFLLAAGLFALLPIVMGLFTAYLKVSVVLGMVRSALGTQHTPSGLVVMALSIALTGYIMTPVLEACYLSYTNVQVQSLAEKSAQEIVEAYLPIIDPIRTFLEKHSGERELRALTELSLSGKGVALETSKMGQALDPQQIPIKILLPAFVLTELKEAFAMAFVLLLPFLIVDLVVANLLVGMGMMMVSPIMVSLPIKLALLVMSDGWLMIARGLLLSYQ